MESMAKDKILKIEVNGITKTFIEELFALIFPFTS